MNKTKADQGSRMDPERLMARYALLSFSRKSLFFLKSCNPKKKVLSVTVEFWKPWERVPT